jgi:toxin CptA
MLRLALKPSRLLGAIVVTAHAAAGVTLVPLALPAWMRLAAAAGLVLSLGHALWYRVLLRGASSVADVELLGGDDARLFLRNGAILDARVLETSYVTPLLTVLNLRLAEQRCTRHVVLLRDSAEAETLRRARVLLRWAYRPEP